MEKKYVVAIMDCNSYDFEKVKNKINEGVSILGGWEKFIRKNSTVLLKPNMIGPKKPEEAATTHPVILQAVIRILRELECTVWIGDSSGGALGGNSPTKQSFEVTGFLDVAGAEEAKLKNFDTEGAVKIVPESGLADEMYIAKPLFEAEYIINLPKLKTHVAALYTGAVKNMFGCIPGLKKAEYHKIGAKPDDFANIIVDINKAVNINLNIMDAIVAMDGDGPTGGSPYEMHKILISDDSMAMDIVATNIINLDVNDVPILKAGIKRKLGCENVSQIEIKGDYNSIPKVENFRIPRTKMRLSGSKAAGLIIPLVLDFIKTKPVINANKCKQCNMCVNSCPVRAIDKESKKIDYNKCIECMCCHELCLYHAVELRKNNKLAGIICDE